MAAERNKRRVGADAIPAPVAPWGRPMAIGAAALFLLSSAFPVIAGLSKNTASFPKWFGTLDVALAFVLVVLGFTIVTVAGSKVDKQAEEASYRAYRILLHGILAMIVVFFVFGDRIIWINCLTGFAWRAWLLLYGLPAWLVLLRGNPAASGRNPPKE